MNINEGIPPYEFGCVMLGFREENLEDIHHVWNYIPKIYLAGDGIETDSHVTIRYGIENGSYEELYKEARDYFSQIKLTITGVGVFQTPDGDCVKFEVASTGELLALRAMVERIFECAPDKHPHYNPHITLAFVQKGWGEGIAHDIREATPFPFEVTGCHLIYMPKNGKRSVIPLKTSEEVANESMHYMLAEKYKAPYMMSAKIVVPKKLLSDYAIKKHTKRIEKLGGKYERHKDGRDIFRIPAAFARQVYHEIFNTRGIIPDKKEPALGYY